MKKLLILLFVGLAYHANAQNNVVQTLTAKKFRFAVNAGFSQLLAKTAQSVSPQNRAYIDGLKSGYHYGVDGAFFISKDWGLGLKFNQFRSTHNGLLYNENNTSMNIATTLVNTFIGPSLATKYDSPNNKHTFLFNLAIGYMGYLSKNDMIPVQTTGGTVGSALDAGYDYHMTKNFAIGAQFALVGGVLNRLTYKNGNASVTEKLDDNQKESMSRLDFSLGARLNF